MAKRTCAAALAAVTALVVAARPAVAQAPAQAPQVTAASAILIDPSDGKVLWEKDSGRRRQIASLTKVLTALVVIENSKPSRVISASAAAEAVGSDDPLVTELELTAGEKLTVQQLLYAMLLPSANDAAVALAEGLSGSASKFAMLMNQTARRLGARSSRFVNPSGFDDPGHYSSAGDLALITRAALRNETFRKIVATPSYSISRQGRPPQTIRNRNLLLGSFPGANGVKTGQTKAAGKALIASADRAGEQRLSVVLSSADPVADSAAMLDWGFTAFSRLEVARSGRTWGLITYGTGATAEIVAKADMSMLIKASDPPPQVTYLPGQRALVVAGGKRVPVSVKCSLPSCRPHRRLASPVAWVIAAFSPLIGLFR